MSTNKVQKQDVLQAVVVASFFHKNFWPAADGDTACLMPLVNRPLLHYTLDMLESAGIVDVVVFCSSGSADRIRDSVQLATGARRLNVVYTTSDTCRSFGDVLRHLDSCALIRNDFVLLWGNVVGRLPLLPLVKRFKSLRQSGDRGAVMTIVYQRSDDTDAASVGDQTIVLAADTGRVLFHNRARGKISLPLELVLDSTMDIRRDLVDTNVVICSTAVPPLFADNFDFQTKDDFVKGLLINEEILNSTLYAHVVDSDGYAGEVFDWPSYQRVTRDVLHRWTYPQVPEVVDKYSLRYGNVYIGENLKLALTCNLGNDTVVGSDSKFGSGTCITNTVIGKNCTIGNNVKIETSYIFNGVTVKDRSVIRFSVVGDNSVIKENSHISDSCILGDGVVIEPNTDLKQIRILSSDSTNKLKKLSVKAYAYNAEEDSDSEDDQEVRGLTFRTRSCSINSCSSSDDDTASVAASIPDDICMFYSEVVDSLIRGFEDHVHCDNLILEINSSRYAYNINYREANFQVIRAMLTLNSKAELEALNQVRYYTQLQSKLDYFLPVLRNYIKSTDSCEDCLSAIEDIAKDEELLNTVIVKVIHHLYNMNILSEESILKWHEKEEDTQFAKTVREKANKLIEWLKDAEEETDSDDDDSL